MNFVRSNNLNLKYYISGYRDIGIRTFELVTETQFLYVNCGLKLKVKATAFKVLFLLLNVLSFPFTRFKMLEKLFVVLCGVWSLILRILSLIQ